MSLFNLSSILFGEVGKSNDNKLLSSNIYGYDIYKYPIDIGTSERGHYMIFHINAQKTTQENFQYTNELPTVFENRNKFNTTAGLNYAEIGDTLGNLVDSFDITKNIKSGLTDFANSNNINPESIFREWSQNGARTIRRTTQTIALYMPDSLNFGYTQQYNTLTPGNSPLNKIAGAAAAGVDAFVHGEGAVGTALDMAGNLAPYLASSIADQAGDFGRSMFTSIFGVTKNPMLEVIYTAPDFRRFNFDFFFHARNEIEAFHINEIIRLFKYHQAPEILKSSYGFFLVPPSEFDIKFYYNENENPNIPKISTCILQDINVDYAPNGFAAYEVPGQPAAPGSTGMPVGIRLTLSFMEAEYLTKDHFRKTDYGRNF